MADEPITDITYASQLKQIQLQLAALETSYANMTRTYYNMFYNNTPMDITLQIYDEDGALKTITVPNRAKASTSTLTYAGSPLGVLQAALGTLVIDTTTGELWYESLANDVDGWVRLANHNALSDEYLKKNGNGELLTNLNADSVTQGQLEVAIGGTGVSGTKAINMSGMLKMVPQTTDTSGVVNNAHLEIAEVGVDYLDSATLAGMIVFFPVGHVPAGYLVCNGDAYSKETYADLYKYLSNEGTTPCPYGETDDKFAVPAMDGFFVRCTTDFSKRPVGSEQNDGIPNFKCTWSMEITGGEANFTGATSIVLDETGNYKQVDGKSSAPSGSYDYLIQMNPQDYNEACAAIYQDDLEEVRVKNIAMVPAIKF